MSDGSDDSDVELGDEWGLVHPDDPEKILEQAKLDIENMQPVVEERDAVETGDILRDAVQSGEKAIRRITRVQEHVEDGIVEEDDERCDGEQRMAPREDVFIRAYADLVSASVALQMTGPGELVDDVNEAKSEVRGLIEELRERADEESV
jgi:hypothetical protein